MSAIAYHTGNYTVVQQLAQANNKERSTALLTLCEGNPRPLIDSPHKGSVMQKAFMSLAYHDVIMKMLVSHYSDVMTGAIIQAQIKENTKAPRHWALWGEFPAQRASNAENVYIWWRHHVMTSSWKCWCLRSSCSRWVASLMDHDEWHGNILTLKSHLLTHWDRDKMDAIFQTTFPNAFVWMNVYEFRFSFPIPVRSYLHIESGPRQVWYSTLFSWSDVFYIFSHILTLGWSGIGCWKSVLMEDRGTLSYIDR